jgi:hypothetical protein
VTPVTLRFRTCGVGDESETTESVPLRLPIVVGFTEMEKLAACPAGTFRGGVIPERTNCGLDSVTCVMLTEFLPGFLKEIFCEDCFPTPTLPKLTLCGFTCSEPGCVLPPGLLNTPAQPFRTNCRNRRLAARLHQR